MAGSLKAARIGGPGRPNRHWRGPRLAHDREWRSPVQQHPDSALPTPEQRASVTIGNVAATVSFSGIPPGIVGVVQMNVQAPASVATGTQPVVVTIGGIASAPVSLTVTP